MENIFPEWEIGLFNFKEVFGKDPSFFVEYSEGYVCLFFRY